MRETRWWVSPFLRAGWWTRGVGRERVLEIGAEDCKEEEDEEEEEPCEEEENEASSEGLCKRLSGLEAEHPMNEGMNKERKQ